MVKDTYTFSNGFKIKISLTDNPLQIKYSFFNDLDQEIKVLVAGLPTHVSTRSGFVSQIKKCINPDGKVKYEQVVPVITILQDMVLNLQGEAEVKLIQEKQELELTIRRKSHEAKKFMENLEDPLFFIGSVIDWLTAGERINTLICFVAGCSQVILKEPISVIGYGESSSGKTFIQTVALSLLPEEFICIEKQVSPAALFNRSRQDKFYYDGKIVSYGDMGGQNDRDNMQETLDLMKELQTDGKLVKPVSIKGESNKWEVEDLELEGTPALWYATVPVDIDSQELSRAIVYTPRTDNRDIFNKRGRLLSLKRSKTCKDLEAVEKKAEIIPYMVLHLREIMEEYIIIDPYYSVISEFLTGSKFYKRDTEKYMNMLDTITAINFYQNEKYVFDDGQKAIITSKNDVQLLLSLLEPYMTSISVNVKPKSVEVYETMKANIDEWKAYKGADFDGYNDAGFQVGITIREYFEKPENDIPLSSLNRYFSDLYRAGLLTIVGKDNRANMYDVVDFNFDEIIHELDFESIIETVEYELGSDIADIIRRDVLNPDMNINNKHDSIGDTLW